MTQQADEWEAMVDYGDGSDPESFAVNEPGFDIGHMYADCGTYTLRVTVTDDDGGEGADSLTVDVRDTTPPEITCPDDATVEQLIDCTRQIAKRAEIPNAI